MMKMEAQLGLNYGVYFLCRAIFVQKEPSCQCYLLNLITCSLVRTLNQVFKMTPYDNV